MHHPSLTQAAALAHIADLHREAATQRLAFAIRRADERDTRLTALANTVRARVVRARHGSKRLSSRSLLLAGSRAAPHH